MASITTRATKGSALTWTEADNNITNLNTAKLENVVEDLTPQLGGNLDTNGKDITSASNGNVTIAPHGSGNINITPATGKIILGALEWPTSTGTNGQVLTTNGTTAASWTTVSAGATTLDGLSDVVITAAATNDVLVYNGTNWVDTALSSVTVGTATTATNANNININTTDGNFGDTSLYPVFVSSGTTGNQLPHLGVGGIIYNGTTGVLTASGFSGPHNGTVGASSPSTGAFTTLSASSTVSGTGFTNRFAAPGPIGSTTASTGAFTTISASGVITSTQATGTAPFTVASTTNVANLNASSLNGATFAAPGAIGGTTAAAGTFTALTSTGLTTLKTYKETISAGGSQASAYTPDYSLGTVHTITLTGNVTFAAPTNMAAGNSLTLILTQDATGSRTGSWNASYKWLGGTPTLSTTAASIDIVNIFYDGTNYITGISKQDTSASVSGLTITAAGELRLADTDSSNYVGFKSPGTVSANKVWTLPATDGTNGQVLSTNGSATLSWATAGGGGASMAVISQDSIKGTLITGSTYRQTISEVADPSGIITVASNQFTVGAGTYIVEFVGVNKCTTVGAVFQHGLYDVTGAANIDNFAGGLNNDGTSTTRWVFQWSHVITPASSNTYEFRCLLDATSNTVALVGTNARFRITKIG